MKTAESSIKPDRVPDLRPLTVQGTEKFTLWSHVNPLGDNPGRRCGCRVATGAAGYIAGIDRDRGGPMTADPRYEQEETEAAAAEAARIGGVAGDEDLDPATRPVLEGGGGEAEGFEQAEEALIEHATHGDQQSAHAVIHDAGR